MKIGIESIKNNSEKLILNTEEKNENQVSKNEQIEYEFFSHNIGKKFNVDYEVKMVTFEDGVTYSFNEIRDMKQNITTLDVCIGHVLKDVFRVTYAGKVISEVEDV